MANTTMNMKILQVCKTTTQWDEVTDVISKGLLCIEFAAENKILAKVGNGTDTYGDLPYLSDGSINIANYYTSAQTDTAISNAIAAIGDIVTIKGVKETYDTLPESGNEVGDIWFVGTEGSGDDSFEEYVWTSSEKWEYLGKHQVAVDDASTTTKGIIKIATEITDAGADATTTAATPALVKGYVDQEVGNVDTGVMSVTGTAGRVAVSGTDDVTIDLAASGATAGTYGPTASATLADGTKFNVPKVTVDEYGRVTAAENVEYTAGSHTHTNKTVLDDTEVAYTQDDKDKLDALHNYTLPTASATELGGVKVGTNLSIDSDGVLSATDTTYSDMTGATAADEGAAGLVPKPVTGDQNKFLKGDGTWDTPTDTTYENATTTTAGLMSAADKTKLDGLENYDDTELAGRVQAIEDDYIKSTDVITVNCIL